MGGKATHYLHLGTALQLTAKRCQSLDRPHRVESGPLLQDIFGERSSHLPPFVGLILALYVLIELVALCAIHLCRFTNNKKIKKSSDELVGDIKGHTSWIDGEGVFYVLVLWCDERELVHEISA